MKLRDAFQTLRDLLTSQIRIGALEVSGTAIKYLLIRGTSIVQASLRLPPGVIEKGTIKNRELFVAALRSLHQQITPVAAKPINVVLAIPSSLVFAQSFSVPIVAKENLEEAIKLNLQMVSPNKIEDSYYDYQEIQLNKDLGHLDLLGAFTAMSPISGYEQALREANFIPASVEFPGLSLARLIKQRWGGIELEQHYLIMYLSSEGLLMMILKNGNLAFNHFTSWQETETADPQSLTFEKVRDVVRREIQRVLNYYMSRTGKNIEEVVLISPVFNYEIVKMASEDLKLKIRNLTIAELPKLQPGWFPTLGCALRGLISRSKDTDISLAATSSQTEYYQERALHFIDLWRNILVGSLVVILGAFITIDSVFSREQAQLRNQLENGFDAATIKNSNIVQAQIAEFNALLSTVTTTQKKEAPWSPTLATIERLAGKDISLDRVFVGKSDLKGIIAGHGASDEAILSFKSRLLADPRIASVDLPLSNIRVDNDKSSSFTLTLVFKSL